MKLAPAQLDAHLQKDLAALYLIFGAEPLGCLEAADAIRAAARQKGFGEREIFNTGTGFQWQTLFMSLQNRSLFGDSKLIELNIANGKPGREGGDALQRLAAHASEATPDTLILVNLGELDWASRKSKWFTTLSAAAVNIESNPPERGQLAAWIANRLARQQQSAAPEALAFIAEHVEGNLLAAHQEILKLGLLHPPGALSLAAVEEAILDVSRYNTDNLRDAWLARDRSRYLRVLKSLESEAIALPIVLWAVSQEVRALALLAEAQSLRRNPQDVFRQERIFGHARQNALKKALAHTSHRQAQRALQRCARIDRIAKGLADGDPWQELALL